MQRLVTCSLLLMTSWIQAQTVGWDELFPPEEMRDVASLKLSVSPGEARASTLEPTRTLRLLRVSFTSFRWAGEEWRHQAVVLLPDRRPEAYRGAAAIVSGGGRGARKRAEAAALMGIPALLIFRGNPGPHYGYSNEGELMGFGQKKFLETGDPRWVGYAWLGKVIVRAVTAATAIPEMHATRFVVTGGSKRGAASWIAAAADDRIVGAFPVSWNAGHLDQFIQLKARRWGWDYQPHARRGTMAPAFVTTRQQFRLIQHPRGAAYRAFTDPFVFRERLGGKKILYAAGTNDPLFPVASDTVFLPKMPSDVRALLVPNTGHGADTKRHLAAWRMWLAHCFAGRDVPTIDATATRNGSTITITATVRSRTTIKAVRVWRAADDRGAYLNVRWQAHSMTRVAPGTYRCTLAASPDQFVGYFVEAADDDPRTVPGIATTGFLELKPDTQNAQN